MRRDFSRWRLSAEERRHILRSLDDVGLRKAVGYLPLYTLREILRTPLSKARRRYSKRGLDVVVISARRAPIESGAIFVYDAAMVRTIVERFRDRLEAHGWDHAPRAIIGRIAQNWLEADHALRPMIDALFGAEEIRLSDSDNVRRAEGDAINGRNCYQKLQ